MPVDGDDRVALMRAGLADAFPGWFGPNAECRMLNAEC
jgi:hypothetical protein